MELINVLTVDTSEEFQRQLMTAILGSLQFEGKMNLERMDNFDEINSQYDELSNLLVKSPAYHLAVEA